MITRKFIILLLLTSSCTLLFGQIFSENNVQAEVRFKESSSHTGIEIEIHLEIPPDVHVYTSEDQFFKVQAVSKQGLGTLEVTIPGTKKYTNFDGSQVDVFHSDKPVVVRIPYSGNGGEQWSLKGYFQFQACTETTCFPPEKKEFSFEGNIPGTVTEEVPFYKKGLILGILFSFLAGLGLSLTPCVYPMVGITVAIIGSGSHSKKKTILLTAVYVLGLSLVYGLVGVIIAGMGEKAHAASEFLRSVWILVPIGIIFMILGLSMFGLINIQTPSSFAGKLQTLVGKLKGSIPGTFIMGGLSAFVIGPCISGPLLGLIIFVMQTGEMVRGFAYFFSLAWGMSIILFMAGVFSGALPKAGVWMNRVKHIMGVVLIWAGFYFMRPIFGETVYWTAGVVAVALGLSAAGLFRIPDINEGKAGVIRLLIGILAFGGFVYFVSCHTEEVTQAPKAEVQLESIVTASGKPVVLEFTAPWCYNCKEIEEKVIKRPDVQEQLKKFTLVKVDFDSNTKLRERFNIIGPPAFVFIDKKGNQIGKTIVTGKELEKALFDFDFNQEY